MVERYYFQVEINVVILDGAPLTQRHKLVKTYVTKYEVR